MHTFPLESVARNTIWVLFLAALAALTVGVSLIAVAAASDGLWVFAGFTAIPAVLCGGLWTAAFNVYLKK